jgi:hypothetical protein
MRIDPNKAGLLTPAPVIQSRKRTHRDGMIPTQYQWESPLAHDTRDQRGEFLANTANERKIFRMSIALRTSLRDRNGDIAVIDDFRDAERTQTLA